MGGGGTNKSLGQKEMETENNQFGHQTIIGLRVLGDSSLPSGGILHISTLKKSPGPRKTSHGAGGTNKWVLVQTSERLARKGHGEEEESKILKNAGEGQRSKFGGLTLGSRRGNH